MNITKLTEQYIDEHPSVKDCVRKGLINYSALTRNIAKDSDIDLKKNFDAVLIACRRYFGKLKKEGSNEKKILNLLKQTKMDISNKMSISILDKSAKLHKDKVAIEGVSTVTLIADKVQKKGRVTENLAAINIKFSEDVDKVSGVLAYLTSLLAENGINILAATSSYREILFVVSENDIAKVMGVFRF